MNLETKNKIRFNTMAIILIILFCIAVTPKTLQNDTFYTIKVGENIIENKGITMQEPFAWYENLEYTFPHWAYDVCIYWIYSIGGMAGIYISTIILASILGIMIYLVNTKLNKNRILSFIITIGTIYLLRDYICARAQLVTFILFILTIYFIEQFLDTKKIGYAVGLIIIPILIANFHLATFYFYFILYLPYLVEFVIYILAYANVIISNSVVESIKQKIKKCGETEELLAKLKKAEEKNKRLKEKEDYRIENPYKIKITYRTNIKWLMIIFVICIFTGFLTPLGTTPYTYLIKTMQGISTDNISEHLPVVLANNKELLITFAVYISLLAFTKIKVRLSDLFMIVGLSLLAIMTRRQSSMVYLIGSVILNRLVTELLLRYNTNIIKKIENISAKFISIAIISIIVVLLSIYQYKPKMDDSYIDETEYPVQASKWIKENLNLSEIKLYNEYNFGSYLIYEDIPVFIDSRCDLYLPEFNENVNIFEDFLNLDNMNYNDMEWKIEQYGFTHFIVFNGVKIKQYMDLNPDKYVQIYPTEDVQDNNFTIYERVNEE